MVRCDAGARTDGAFNVTLNGHNAASDLQIIPTELLAQNATVLLGRNATVDFLVVTDGKV